MKNDSPLVAYLTEAATWDVINAMYRVLGLPDVHSKKEDAALLDSLSVEQLLTINAIQERTMQRWSYYEQLGVSLTQQEKIDILIAVAAHTIRVE